MDASRRLFSNDEDRQPKFEGPEARILAMERPSEEKDPGLIFPLFLALFGLILIVDQGVRGLFCVPGKPGGIVYIPVILGRVLDGFGRAVEDEGKVRVQRVGQGGDDKAQMLHAVGKPGRIWLRLLLVRIA